MSEIQAKITALSPRDLGRIVGAFEARGGVVLSANNSANPEYTGVRLYIETLTVNAPLHALFGEPRVRTAYARPVYRYEVTNRAAARDIATMLSSNVFDTTRKRELSAVLKYCTASDFPTRAAAIQQLSSARVTV